MWVELNPRTVNCFKYLNRKGNGKVVFQTCAPGIAIPQYCSGLVYCENRKILQVGFFFNYNSSVLSHHEVEVPLQEFQWPLVQG